MKLFYLTLALCLVIFTPKPAQSSEETTYERVMRTGVIRCAYISWKPYSLKDANQPDAPPQGSSVDIMTALADRLGLKIEWTEEIGWGTIGEGFATNRYDAVCTQMWPDAAKLRNFLLGTPMFYSAVRLYATQKAMSQLALDRLNEPTVRIAVIDGALSEQVARQAYPLATLVRLPPTTSSGEFYLTLTTGKADVTLADADEIAAQREAGLTGLTMLPDAPALRVLPHVFAFPSNDLRFAAMMNQGLNILQAEGFFTATKQRYRLVAQAAE
jgi:ABC-type amino acid transport substrate-binding protein